MKSGTKPTKISHKDFDFIKSHKYGAASPAFEDEYFADAGLTMPNQEVPDNEFTPPTPALPFGCTDFTQAELKTDLTKQIHNPLDLENITHANDRGGIDIRESLDAARKQLGWFSQYFNIRTSGVLDFFDSMRLAQISGINASENRSITWGTPWFTSWENAARNGTKIMPMPTAEELDQARKSPNTMAWHNSKLDGWTTKNGVVMYRDKSWQGADIGFLFFPREVINMVMTINGSVAYVATNNPVTPITISVTTLQFILSVLRNLLKKYVAL